MNRSLALVALMLATALVANIACNKLTAPSAVGIPIPLGNGTIAVSPSATAVTVTLVDLPDGNVTLYLAAPRDGDNYFSYASATGTRASFPREYWAATDGSSTNGVALLMGGQWPWSGRGPLPTSGVLDMKYF